MISLKKITLVSWLLAIFCFALNSRATDVNVFAAASLSDALQKIAKTYAKTNNDKIHFNFAASSVLERQIEEGAPADIFFSADEAKMDALEKKDMIRKDTRKSLLSNALVIVIEAKHGVEISRPDDLGKGAVKRLALAEPNTVPAGIYAKAYLQKIDLWPLVENKIVPTENVRATLAAVESGNVEAGFVYKTDAQISKKVKIAYEVPQKDGPDISYPVAQIKSSSNTAAGKFLEYLETPDAKIIFRKFGFLTK